MCGLEEAALQKSVLSGTRALLQGSNQLWSRQGATLTEGVAKMPGSYAAIVFAEGFLFSQQCLNVCSS